MRGILLTIFLNVIFCSRWAIVRDYQTFYVSKKYYTVKLKKAEYRKKETMVILSKRPMYYSNTLPFLSFYNAGSVEVKTCTYYSRFYCNT